MFAKRFVSAVVLLAVFGFALMRGGIILLSLSVLASLAGTFELLKVANMQKSVPGCICYVSVIGFYPMIFFGYGDRMDLWAAAVVLFMLAVYVFTYPRHHVRDIAICLFAVFYVGILFSYVLRVRCLPYGNWFVWLIVIIASGSDTFAYLTGSLIGKHHFSKLSPKKTVEGCVGGVVGAALLAGIYSIFFSAGAARMFEGRQGLTAIFVGVALVGSVISQVGDLAASAIKRNYGVKDYGDLIPGHGGVMDRIDSMLFVAPLVYYMLCFIFT